MYEQLYMPLFISGYVAMLNTAKSGVKEILLKHLRDLMTDAAMYGWEPI